MVVSSSASSSAMVGEECKRKAIQENLSELKLIPSELKGILCNSITVKLEPLSSSRFVGVNPLTPFSPRFVHLTLNPPFLLGS